MPALGLGLLILVTATLFGLAPRLVDQVGDDALQGVAANANALSRNIALIEETGYATEPNDPLARVNREGERLLQRMPAGVQALVAEQRVVIDSPRYSVRADTSDPTTIRFRVQPGAEERVRYTAGVAPVARRQLVPVPDEILAMLPPVVAPDEPPERVTLLETAIAAEGLRQSGLAVGDTVFLTADGTDPLAGRRAGLVAVRITGALEAIDPADPFWFDDRSLNQLTIRSMGGDSRFLDMVGLLPVGSYEGLAGVATHDGVPLRYTWRHVVDPERLSANRLGATITDLRRLEAAFPQTQASNAGPEKAAMRSGLLPLLLSHSARWASASAILTVVSIGPAAVAVAALALVATITARRRRPAIALVRGRGASLGQIVRAVFLEGFVIAVPALGLAILLAVLLIPTGSTRATILAATVVATTAIALLIATALPGTAAAARAARDDDETPRSVGLRRLVLDAAVITGTAVGAYLLRERGVRGTSSAGTLEGADPLIAAVPALAGIAAGLAAIRLVPLPLRVLSRVAGRGRGLVPLLALRRAIHGGTTAAVLIVLLAAASIGAFSSSALVHLDRASEAASWHEVGAPYRVNAQVGSLPAALDPAKLPGVAASATMFRSQVAVGTRNLRVEIVAVELAAYQAIVGGSPVDPLPPAEMLTPEPAGGVIPVLVAQGLTERSDGVKLGQPTEIVTEGYHYRILPIATRIGVPTLPTGTLFVLASREQMNAIHPEAPLAPTTLFLDAPADDAAQAVITDAVHAIAAGATIQNRAVFARTFRESPVTAAIITGIALAALVAALYATLAVTAALALAGAARSTEVAHLRVIGLSRREALGLAVVEHGPTVLLAFIAGVALGLGLFVLLQPGLGLDALVGSRLEVPVTADPRMLGLIFAAVLAIATVGIGLAAWMQQRGVAVAALRRGVE